MKFKETLARKGHKALLYARVYGPKAAIIAGTAGLVGSAVLIGVKSRKAVAIHDTYLETLDDISSALEQNSDYSEEMAECDRKQARKTKAIGYAKLYAPAAGLMVVSAGMVLGGNRVLCKRNAALAAANTALSSSFKAYRGRVAERFGQDVEQEIRTGVKRTTETVVETDENGNTVVKEVERKVPDENVDLDFARYFDCHCLGWRDEPSQTLDFLRNTQRFFDDKLHKQGYLPINDIYRYLGIPVTPEGLYVGWYLNENDPNWKGDNYVDFGIDIDRMTSETMRDFLNRRSQYLVLDFNHDGDISSYLKPRH